MATRTLYDPHGKPVLLCDECSAQVAGGMLVHKMLLPVLAGPPRVMPAACPSCGTTLQQLHQSSLLGCSDCYRHFREAILITIQRMQGSICHKPRGPASEQDDPPALPPAGEVSLKELQSMLDLAVAEERYEDAALYRDQIRGQDKS